MRILWMLCPDMGPGAAAAQMGAAWGRAPDWLWVQHGAGQPAAAVGRAFAAAFPAASLHVATSALGAMGAGDVLDGAIGALGLWDAAGDYGTAAVTVAGDARAAARAALGQALDQAGRPGEAPDLVWVSARPDLEGEAVAELRHLVGPGTPVHGGRAADDGARGGWAVGDGRIACGDGLVLSVLFPGAARRSVRAGSAPWAAGGALVAAMDRRTAVIDRRPPGWVRDGWTAGPALCQPMEGKVPALGPGPSRLLAGPGAGGGRAPLPDWADIG